MPPVKRDLEIILKNINVNVTGAGLLKRTAHLLNAELIWPRVCIAKRLTAQACELVAGEADFEPLNWGQRVLFKETVSHRFALNISLSEVLNDEALEKFLRAAAGAALVMGADAATAFWGPLAKLLTAPLEAFAKDISTYPGPTTLVDGMVEIDATTLPASGQERLLTIPLSATHNVVRVTRRTVNKHTRFIRKTLLARGAPNGTVTVLLRSL